MYHTTFQVPRVLTPASDIIDLLLATPLDSKIPTFHLLKCLGLSLRTLNTVVETHKELFDKLLPKLSYTDKLTDKLTYTPSDSSDYPMEYYLLTPMQVSLLILLVNRGTENIKLALVNQLFKF